MALGTFDSSPPPFFRQGPSALTRVLVFSSLAVFLMVADTRFKVMQPVRAALATAVLPIERALLVPVEMLSGGSQYMHGLQKAQQSENAARLLLTAQSDKLARAEQLVRENQQLRALLGLRDAIQTRSVAAQILYDAPDPFSRRVVIDQGSTHGVQAGSPVVNELGVLGQVTRVYPLAAEVTLLTDRDAAVPVLNLRTQQRGAAFGLSNGREMELRFMAGNADIQVGDALDTSGVDGIYPAGLHVAKVVSVDRKADTGFARVLIKPVVAVDGVRHVLILQPLSVQLPPRPVPIPEPVKPSKKGGKK